MVMTLIWGYAITQNQGQLLKASGSERLLVVSLGFEYIMCIFIVFCVIFTNAYIIHYHRSF